MRYVRLGRTDLQVSAIAFGTWSFGGDWGAFDADEAKKTVGRALDLGVTFFDTAQAYGFGASERLLADALWSQVGRDRVVVATKGGLRKDGATLRRDASARSHLGATSRRPCEARPSSRRPHGLAPPVTTARPPRDAQIYRSRTPGRCRRK